jgi:hypothetical protein
LAAPPWPPWLPRLKRIGQRRFNYCRNSIGQLRETQPARSTARQLLKNNGKLRTLAAAPSLFHDMTDTWLEMLVTPVPLARRPPATRFTGFCVSLDASASLPHCLTASLPPPVRHFYSENYHCSSSHVFGTSPSLGALRYVEGQTASEWHRKSVLFA